MINNILDQINASHKNMQLNSLLNNAKFIEVKNSVLTFAVQDSFVRETLIRNYFMLIKKSATNINNNIKIISIIIDSSIMNHKLFKANLIASESIIKKTSENNIFSKTNSKFTFCSYVTGKSNIVPYKISKDIALQNIGYCNNNVFYIHSHIGMGKTHLLQSIVNEVNHYNEIAQYKNNTFNKWVPKKVGYLSAERFMHNFVRSVRNNTLFELRDEIKKVDIFLIDDLHFICGKESTQREFTYILNFLIELNKKIVIASTVPCQMLDFDDERTKSILRSSNTIYIEPSNYTLRLNILRYYNQNSSIKFEENILSILAEKITKNNRELEGALNNLKIYLNISGSKVIKNNICNYIQNYIKTSVKTITVSSIINAVAKYYKIPLSDILSKKRTHKLVIARQIIAYLAKEITVESFNIIGKNIGGRNHSTILYYLKKLSISIKKNKQIVNEVEKIKNSII